MDKTTAGLLGAVAGLAVISSAQAATQPAPNPSEALQASTYADLLTPIPNAVALLRAEAAAPAKTPAAEGLDGVQVAQGYYPYSQGTYSYSQPYYSQPYYAQPSYHHHHHNSYYRPYYQQHHHHHH
ncbi:MAG TPA: hypothetical protein VNF04_06110 [Stellaceae bacterium]|nr:hypothetical protein [Stellaceae bacterium]